MACGTPVICSNVWGQSSSPWRDGETGGACLVTPTESRGEVFVAIDGAFFAYPTAISKCSSAVLVNPGHSCHVARQFILALISRHCRRPWRGVYREGVDFAKSSRWFSDNYARPALLATCSRGWKPGGVTPLLWPSRPGSRRLRKVPICWLFSRQPSSQCYLAPGGSQAPGVRHMGAVCLLPDGPNISAS